MAYTTAELAALYAAANGLNPLSQHVQIMAAIATAESGGRSNAKNPNSSATGLWQVLQSHSRDAGWPFGSAVSSFTNPVTNARMAEYIYRKQGYGAWTTYTSGAYKRYLSGASSPNNSPQVQQTVAANGQNANLLPMLPNLGGLAGGAGAAAGGAATGALGTLLGLPAFVTSVGLWRRVGIASLGLLIIFIGLVILLRKPIETGVSTAATVAPLAAA